MIKNVVKKLVRNLGLEIRRYIPQVSESARLQYFLKSYNIDLVLDVGANIGQYAKYIRDLGYSQKIVSFEPLSSAYSQLQAISNKDPLWEVAPRSAIGDKEDKIQINISANSQSSSVLDMLEAHLSAAPESMYCGAETVNLSRLDNIAKEYITNNTNSIFLKIDVQGFEKQVIEGSTQLLPIIKGIQMELSLVPLYKNQVLFQDMVEFMKQLGYELHAFTPGFTDSKTGRLLQLDGIFFKK